MLTCDFNKVALQVYENHTLAWVFSSKFAAYFQNTFSQKHLWVTASIFYTMAAGYSAASAINYISFSLFHFT